MDWTYGRRHNERTREMGQSRQDAILAAYDRLAVKARAIVNVVDRMGVDVDDTDAAAFIERAKRHQRAMARLLTRAGL